MPGKPRQLNISPVEVNVMYTYNVRIIVMRDEKISDAFAGISLDRLAEEKAAGRILDYDFGEFRGASVAIRDTYSRETEDDELTPRQVLQEGKCNDSD